VEIDSPHGPDAFLLEAKQVGPAVETFLQSLEDGDLDARHP
jgi:homoserine acetyltransferase